MDASTYIQAFLVLILVLGLIVALSAGLKRLGMAGGGGPLGRKRRLATIEALMLDGRHRAILIRRDDVEHLVVVGPNTSHVIEHGIPARVMQEEPASAAAAAPSPISALSQFLSKDKKP